MDLTFNTIYKNTNSINNFSGKLFIHSGNGLVIVDKDGGEDLQVNRILGTLAQFMIYYN